MAERDGGSANVMLREETAGAAIGLAAILLLGVLLGIALGFKMELGKERVTHRLDGYREAWQMLRGSSEH